MRAFCPITITLVLISIHKYWAVIIRYTFCYCNANVYFYNNEESTMKGGRKSDFF